MSILDRYIARQIIAITTLGVMALSALLILGNLFKEIRSLLIDSNASIGIVFEFVFQVLPFSLMFSIPWGFLTAVLLVYGRLAADNELTSMRMAGLSLWRLSMPAIWIGIALSGVCYWINIDISPRAKHAITEILAKAVSVDPKSLFKEGQSITKFNGQEIFIDKQLSEDEFAGMHIFQKAEGDKPETVMHSEKVLISFNPDTKIIRLDMTNTFIEITDEKGRKQSVIASTMPLEFDANLVRTRKIRANRFTNEEIREALDTPGYLDEKQRREFATEMPKRASFSLACIVFALIGVPLAINTRRKDTSSGFALGIMIAALYFVALSLAEVSRKSSGITPYILLWLPNVITVAVALYLHKKAQLKG